MSLSPVNSRSRYGQVATEFMLYTTVFMFIVVVSFVIVNQLQSTEVPLQQNRVAKETGEGFANALTLSVKGGEGFSYNYTFPKTIFGIPYKMDFTELTTNRNTMILEWEGPYGNFSYSYNVPTYNYIIGGGCLSGNVLISNQCSNVLMLNNDGENLTITQS